MAKKSTSTKSGANKQKSASLPAPVVIAKKRFLAAKAAMKRARAKFRQARKAAKRLKKLLRVAKQNAARKSKRGIRDQQRPPEVKTRSGNARALKSTTREVSRPRIPTRNKTSSKARLKPVVAPRPGEKPAAPKSARSTKPKGGATLSSRPRPSPPRSAVVEAPQPLVGELPGEPKVATPVIATDVTPAT